MKTAAIHQKRKPETLWKLIESRSAQLSDSVTSARTPFLLALVWAAVMAWQNFVGGYGYLGFLRTEAESRQLLVEIGVRPDATASDRAKAAQTCNKFVKGVKFLDDAGSVLSDKDAGGSLERRLALCNEVGRNRLKWFEDAFQDSHEIAFPGSFTKLNETDASVIGQLGLLLIMVWEFYAFRRENHAVRSFVDRDPQTPIGSLKRRFVLAATDNHFSAEHVAFAYNAVSQRFLFLLSSFSRPALPTTIALCAAPAIAMIWIVETDVFQILTAPHDIVRQPVLNHLQNQIFIELALLLCILYATLYKILYTIDTGFLINAWSLAVRHIWMDEWDERTEHPASKVQVNLDTQEAGIAS